jgi:hypothetical protein
MEVTGWFKRFKKFRGFRRSCSRGLKVQRVRSG